MIAEDEEINKELHELWLQDYEKWEHEKKENRKHSVKRFRSLFVEYVLILTVGIYIGIISQLHFSLLAITFYVLAIFLCSFLFIFIFHHRELQPENPPLPKKYIWENGELKVEPCEE